MKKTKDLIALRLRCLLNNDFSFDETVNDLYQDMKDGKVFNVNNFLIGFAAGGVFGLLILNYLTR